MRLLNVKTHKLEQFFEPNIPPYAILSHRWEEDELSFQELQGYAFRLRKGFKKIRFACDQASQDHLGFVWIDTCCIDKSSSAELQEAINSMFRWYQNAVVCYAFLSDVHPDEQAPARFDHKSFSSSVYFKRGWTLQEIIAPEKVMFYGTNWLYLGSRDVLRERLSYITGIPREVLSQRQQPLELTLGGFPVARRMSWAASRETTRIEDRAYSLMGLFGVYMPLLYGEGQRAFVRLQEEILKVGTDLSILAWRHSSSGRSDRRELLAACPEDFAQCNSLLRSPQVDHSYVDAIGLTLTMTNVGLRVEGPLITTSQEGPLGRGLALSLECRTDEDITKVFALKLEELRWPVSPDSHQPPDKEDKVCYAGWDNDGARAEDRIIAVGLLKPAQSPEWPSLTILRNLVPAPLSPSDTAHWYTHIWVQLPEDKLGSTWNVLKVHPEQEWNLKNLTLDLRKMKYAIDEERRFVPGFGGFGTQSKRCAIALSTTLGGRFAIMFKVTQRYHLGSNDRMLFAITGYKPDTFTSDIDVKNPAQGSSSWFLKGHNKVVLRLHDVKRSGIFIAQFALSIEPAKSADVCDPPYELEARKFIDP